MARAIRPELEIDPNKVHAERVGSEIGRGHERKVVVMRRSAMLALVVVMIVPVVLVGGTALAASTCFSDVDDAAWYEPFICWAADNGIVTGYPDGTFRPDRSVSRAEVATDRKSVV